MTSILWFLPSSKGWGEEGSISTLLYVALGVALLFIWEIYENYQ